MSDPTDSYSALHEEEMAQQKQFEKWWEPLDRDPGQQQIYDDEHEQWIEEMQKITANAFKKLEIKPESSGSQNTRKK